MVEPADPGVAAVPAVSVVVPAGAVDDLLAVALRALSAQEGAAPYEVVVALNAGAPAATRALEQLIAEIGDPRLRWVDASAVRSASYARNCGARAARAPLLAFCDGDDIVRPDWLAVLVEALATHTVVGGRLVEFADAGELPSWRPPATPDALPTFMGVPYLVSANMALTAAAFESVGGFDETLTRCEDIAISWQLIRRGHDLHFEPRAVVDYRVRGSVRTMLRQHYLYGIGMSEVLVRDGRPGDDSGAAGVLLRPNNQPGGLRSPVAVLRKGAIGTGRLVGLWRERRRSRRRMNGR